MWSLNAKSRKERRLRPNSRHRVDKSGAAGFLPTSGVRTRSILPFLCFHQYPRMHLHLLKSRRPESGVRSQNASAGLRPSRLSSVRARFTVFWRSNSRIRSTRIIVFNNFWGYSSIWRRRDPILNFESAISPKFHVPAHRALFPNTSHLTPGLHFPLFSSTSPDAPLFLKNRSQEPGVRIPSPVSCRDCSQRNS
jgi:hypothetical protein